LDAEILTLTTEKGELEADLAELEADYEESTRRKEESDAAKKTNDETNAPEINAVIVAEVEEVVASATGDDLATFVPPTGTGAPADGSSAAGVASGPAQ